MNRIKQLREENGLTQIQLAKKLNKTQQTISLYENGTNEPDLDSYVELSKIFHCSIEYIAGKSDIRNQQKNDNNILDLAKIGFTKENYNPPTEKQTEAIKTIIETIMQDNKKDNKKNDKNK